jgi:hypothetical protein
VIVVRLCGGLGNQLFQYAAGRRLADARKAELVLDLDWYERTPHSDTPRAFELDRYAIRARVATAAERRACQWRNIREKSFDFDPAVLELPDGTYLDGYWQSERYFDDIADAIRRDATPRTSPTLQDQRVGSAISAASAAVSVHVRRGDYVSLKAAADFHGTCSANYYRAALTAIASHVRDPHFFVFSDDLEWARRNIEPPGPVVHVDHNGPATAFQDLRLMSSCDHHIIANSSFSWWGAWLNASADKIVVAPKVWFADARPTPALLPRSWIRL